MYNVGFRLLLGRLCAVEKKMRNYDRVSKYIQVPADFMREGKREGINSQQSYQSQVIQSNLVKVHEP